MPYVIYQVVSGAEGYTHNGTTGLTEARVQFTIVSSHDESLITQAETIRDNIVDALHCFRGEQGNTQIEHAFLSNEYEDSNYDIQAYVKVIEFDIMFRDAITT